MLENIYQAYDNLCIYRMFIKSKSEKESPKFIKSEKK